MNEEVKAAVAAPAATTIVPTGEVVAVEPGQEPVPKISEEHRAQLAEIWNDARATKNAQIALINEAGRLDAERRVVEAEAKVQGMVLQQLDQMVQQKIAVITQEYNIPDGYQIESKTGLISPIPADAAEASTPAQ